MKSSSRLLASLLLCAALAARSETSAPAIDWFAGDVNAAFAAATAQHKPVLMYWGAGWCPPCQQLKATVFQRSDFIAKTRLFIPVYLDGDEAGAQKWGEQFRVTGYPTLVVLSPERVETLRLAGGMDLTQYAQVLDLALADLQPVESLLDAASQRRLQPSECRRLAFNAWVLDDVAPDEIRQRAARLAQAAVQCPQSSATERERLVMVAAYYASEAEAKSLAAGKPPSAALQSQVVAITALLRNRQQAAGNFDVLSMLGEPFFQAVKASGAASATQFNKRYAGVMDAAADNPQFAAADRLYAVANKVSAVKILTGSIPPALAHEARTRLDAALARHEIPYVRSGLLNSALPLFDLLGANEEAYRLLQAELPNTQTPYYYQADLADLAEQLGRRDEALAWSEKAYAGARGAATRFQWGEMYLGALLRMQADDTARIQQVGLAVLGELDGTDRIYRRARTRLATLDAELRRWQSVKKAQRQPVLVALRTRMRQTCVKIPTGDPARNSCDAFLATGL